MDNLVLIAAIGENNELGKNNKLIWYLPNDLKFFKEKTTGHPIIMGYNTFVSLPKILPNREHIVLTSKKIDFPDGVLVFNNKESLMEHVSKYQNDVFVIGGGSIYSQFINDCYKMFLTHINKNDLNADVFFPKINECEWEKHSIHEDVDSNIKYKHIEYRRK